MAMRELTEQRIKQVESRLAEYGGASCRSTSTLI